MVIVSGAAVRLLLLTIEPPYHSSGALKRPTEKVVLNGEGLVPGRFPFVLCI